MGRGCDAGRSHVLVEWKALFAALSCDYKDIVVEHHERGAW